ncbi:MAG: hypothetical protein PHD76_00965 [Methylacidiphilales bacterium]|nr:hypothetical protein [Candidatus Methylacidiphilales bacterium]
MIKLFISLATRYARFSLRNSSGPRVSAFVCAALLFAGSRHIWIYFVKSEGDSNLWFGALMIVVALFNFQNLGFKQLFDEK